MTELEEPRIKMKICLTGEGAVGKTSLIRRFVEDVFDDKHIVTMGAKVTKKELRVRIPDTGRRIRVILTIWDIVGHAGFRDFTKGSFFKGVQGFLAVCDVTRPPTLTRLEGWRNAIQSTAGRVPAYVLANKADLVKEARLWEDDLEAFCESWESPYLLTSAKTGAGVEKAFRGLTDVILMAQFQN